MCFVGSVLISANEYAVSTNLSPTIIPKNMDRRNARGNGFYIEVICKNRNFQALPVLLHRRELQNEQMWI